MPDQNEFRQVRHFFSMPEALGNWQSQLKAKKIDRIAHIRMTNLPENRPFHPSRWFDMFRRSGENDRKETRQIRWAACQPSPEPSVYTFIFVIMFVYNSALKEAGNMAKGGMEKSVAALAMLAILAAFLI